MVLEKEVKESDNNLELFFVVGSKGVYLWGLDKKENKNSTLKLIMSEEKAYGMTWSDKHIYFSLRRGPALKSIKQQTGDEFSIENPDASHNIHQCMYVKERNSVIYTSPYDDSAFEYDIEKQQHRKLIDFEEFLKDEKRKKTKTKGYSRNARILKEERVSHINSVFYRKNNKDENLLDIYFLLHNCGKIDSEVYVSRGISPLEETISHDKVHKVCSGGRSCHNLYVDKEENVVYLDSRNGNVITYFSKNNSYRKTALNKKINWLRGLSSFDGNIVIGASYNFHKEKVVPTEEERSTMETDAAIYILNLEQNSFLEFNLPEFGPIYEIRRLKQDPTHEICRLEIFTAS